MAFHIEQEDGYWLKGIVVNRLGFFGLSSRTCDVFVKTGETERQAIDIKRKELNGSRK